MFLLDTNVISALRRPDRLPPEVAAWADNADVDEFYISAVSILEIEQGILAKERVDTPTGAILRTWFQNDVLTPFADRIVPIDTDVALRCAALHVPDPQPERDGLIAATALVHSMTVVTRNVGDFEPTGVALLNPWAGQN
ncbi:type II toxin-antitoxin system VapC family toxin [Sphingobium chungbukense]|uniref:Twitching motility protein PilT n=1 Tax=Sphingobium chungbukense TaxID=56193 RepID=A0A0M3AP47_9SPHN|nr:type II toxin-antitoxin system VapC family toxin [Sphingobium chungbukense]KKW90304.1 twitching motility protein PilT [Sphingobium chungbukense]